MANSQVPWGVKALEGVVSEPAWRSKPSWYLVATDDRMIPPPAQHSMSKRAGSTVVETKGSHAVYVSQPAAVAALIERAARESASTGDLAGQREVKTRRGHADARGDMPRDLDAPAVVIVHGAWADADELARSHRAIAGEGLERRRGAESPERTRGRCRCRDTRAQPSARSGRARRPWLWRHCHYAGRKSPECCRARLHRSVRAGHRRVDG